MGGALEVTHKHSTNPYLKRCMVFQTHVDQ
jgi:hypothetical protein